MTTKNTAILVSVVALLCLAGGFGAGRYAAPTKTVVTEKVVTVTTDKVVTTVDTDKILNALKTMNTQKDVHTVRIIEKAKDGSTKVTVTQDDKSKSEATSQVQDKTQTVQTKVEEHVVYKDREVTKTVERLSRAQWSLALQPGFEFGTALGLGGEPYNLLDRVLPIKHVMANLTIERRLLGPLYVGAWTNTHLDGGLSLRMEW